MPNCVRLPAWPRSCSLSRNQLVQVYKAAAQFEEKQDIQVLVTLPGHGSKIESAPAANVMDAEVVDPRRRAPKPLVARQSTGKGKDMKEKPRQNAKASNLAGHFVWGNAAKPRYLPVVFMTETMKQTSLCTGY